MLYGICFMQDSQFDFEPLLQELALQNESEIIRIVTKDQNDAQEKPWLFAGAVGESTTRFAARYSRESSRVWVHFLTTQPIQFLRSTAQVHLWFYAAGHTFLSGHPDTPPSVQSSMLFILKWLIRLAAVSSYVLAFLLLLYPLYQRHRAKLQEIPHYARSNIPLLGAGLVAFASILTALAFNTTSCCENDRFYVQATPYLVVISAYIIQKLTTLLLRYRQQVCK
jgi:hypothetical protein